MKHGILDRCLFAGLLLAAAVMAKDKAAPDAPKHMGGMGGTGGMGGGMSMMDMMGDSRTSCMSTSDSLDILLKSVQEARKSDDKSKMKSALESTEAHIVQMKANMGKCVHMMGTMGKMMGGDSMRGMEKGQAGPPTPPAKAKTSQPASGAAKRD